MASLSSKKRTASQLDSKADSGSNKIPKIHPLFSKKPVASTQTGPLQWLKPLGATGSCLHAVHLGPASSTKVAAFDLDGTVIESGFNKPASEWNWWNACVPAKLTEAAGDGYAIVLISNQAGLKNRKRIDEWKTKIGLIAAAVPHLSFRIFAATAKDKYRKPMIGMWEELERLYAEDGGIQIDKSSSFFVGDAAGRDYPKNPGRKKDFASTDRKWALNVGVPFFTPEEYFLGREPDLNFTLRGFDASSLPTLPVYTPSSTPLLPNPLKQELVLFVGYPCLGKSTFYRKYFEPAGYLHINQDTLKSRDKCVKAVQNALAAGSKCVVDNTNRDAYTRRFYIDLAKKQGVPVRCMWFTGAVELAWHNNLYRSLGLPPSVAAREPPREMLPKLAFTSFKNEFEEPVLSEGFSQIKKVNWVFDGTAEERKVWSRWYHLDDKDEKGMSFS
ncbi:polynucleotide kinase 3 phosphatase-domain-containing protein [Mycena sanguinolenta]|nr:polynucleotide kinase 3 phosphatase-domain-containing protein [Mycena sanguinolenta]